MWSKILGKVTGIIQSVADFAPQLGGLISLVKSLISVGLSSEEHQAVLKIRDLFRQLAQVFRDFAIDCDDVADELDSAVASDGDSGSKISFEEGERIVDEVVDFAEYPSRLKDIGADLYAAIRELT